MTFVIIGFFCWNSLQVGIFAFRFAGEKLIPSIKRLGGDLCGHLDGKIRKFELVFFGLEVYFCIPQIEEIFLNGIFGWIKLVNESFLSIA